LAWIRAVVRYRTSLTGQVKMSTNSQIPGVPPAPGRTATVETVVTDQDTAKVLGSGSLDVLATPRLAAWMEQAACEALSGVLEPGQTTVGTRIAIDHTAASPVGMRITTTATIIAVNGREITFKVTAADEAGEIGRGDHTRFIVDAKRFLTRANNKLHPTEQNR